MITRTFGKMGWRISAAGLGTWNIGNQWGMLSEQESEAIIKASFESGMNLIDTAESYGIPNGLSELRLGRALKGIPRDSYFVVSKIGHWGKRTGSCIPKDTVDMIRACGHACAGRMRMDYVDVMLCHEDLIEDPSVYIEGFEALIDDGFIRAYGISTDHLDIVKNFQNISGGKCSVVELDYSLLNRSAENGLIPYCVENNIGILVRGPLYRGLLGGKFNLDSEFIDSVRSGWNKGGELREQYEEMIERVGRFKSVLRESMSLSELALGFVLKHSANMCIVPGATRPEQVHANAAAAQSLIPDELYQSLSDI
jgi:myo-inositol catabolism protein IolS